MMLAIFILACVYYVFGTHWQRTGPTGLLTAIIVISAAALFAQWVWITLLIIGALIWVGGKS